VTAPPTVNLARVVYGADRPPVDDPAELLHEATKLGSLAPAPDMRLDLLERSETLRWSAVRSVKAMPELPRVPLPPPAELARPLGDVLRTRRSAAAFGGAPMSASELSTLLWAAYGVSAPVADAEGPVAPGRTAPSAGALYPLELYVLTPAVDGLSAGLHHYDPLGHALEELASDGAGAALEAVLALPAHAAGAAAAVAITGVFWRSRFKYGLRGYRFTLLEAGHVAQSLVLAATALGLASCPCGRFFERRLDPLLEADGVDESSLYIVLLGSAA
jgi:SagB-type dehydrogenase family enzyme